MSSKHLPYRVDNAEVDLTLEIPTSKSYANRLLILAALAPYPITLSKLPQSTDVLTLLTCLKKIGLKVKDGPECLTLINSFPECELNRPYPIELETGDGGTTNRFLIPFLGRGKQTYLVRPSGAMTFRPLKGLLSVLKELGIEIREYADNAISITGPYKVFPDSNIEVDASETTQFAGGLMMALEGLNVDVIPQGMRASKTYIELTKKLIQDIRSHIDHYEIPPDFSSLSYPLALGITQGRILMSNVLRLDVWQADSLVLKIAGEMGGKIEWTKKGLQVEKGHALLSPLTLDVSSCPDTAPTAAYLASCAKGTSKLTNLHVLCYKESNRLKEIFRLLDLFEVRYQYSYNEDRLNIYAPSPHVSFKEYKAPNDHRMIMAAYLFMRKNSGGLIYNHHHVSKSFPDFFESIGPSFA